MNFVLKFAVIKSGKNQIEIARQARIAESKLSKVVNGHVQPTVQEQKRIAEALNLELEDLFGSDKSSVEYSPNG